MKITKMDPGLKDQVALADFNAAWCAPCRQTAPVIRDLAEKYQNTVAVAEIDINSRADVATRYMVQGIPTLILFDQGREIKRFMGIQPKETLEKTLYDILSDHR